MNNSTVCPQCGRPPINKKLTCVDCKHFKYGGIGRITQEEGWCRKDKALVFSYDKACEQIKERL